MQAHPEIKRFVQGKLGCSCPEKVFNEIECQKTGDGMCGNKICVGGRLLIYIVIPDTKSSIQDVINSALQRGVAERDGQGFNRFRLVLVSSRPDALRSSAERCFDSSEYTDEKTHLHVVSEKDVENLGIPDSK